MNASTHPAAVALAAVKRPRLTPEQSRALAAYQFAEREEDRLGGSVFANSFNMRQKAERTRAAYEACKRLGMDWRHGL